MIEIYIESDRQTDKEKDIERYRVTEREKQR